MSSADTSQRRDNNFNLLRFVAATLVLITHSFALSTGSASSEPLRDSLGVTFGSIAVDLFFVTSGFLICGSLLSRSSFKAFVAARLLRIYPGLWVALVLTVLVMGFCATSLSVTAYFTHTDTWKYLAFNGSLVKIVYRLPGVFETNPWPNGVNGSLWTLPYELQMYLGLIALWGVATWLPGLRGRSFLRLCFLMVLALATGRLAIILGWEIAGRGFALISLGYMFFAGVALRLTKDRLKWSVGIAVPMMLALFASTIDRLAFDLVYFACVPYLVLYLAFVPSGAGRSFNRFGDYSYGIYIYAFPVQQMVAYLWTGVSPYEMMAVSFVVTLVLAVGSWHWIEKHALSLKARFETNGATEPRQVTI